jgi:eukaryotic-like serine/threonine-protein kinase
VLGASVGNYRIIDLLGQGGMAVVYLGQHEKLSRQVAVKVLRQGMPTSADMLKRFFNEAQATTAIQHPGIVQVFDFGTTADGNAFLVMELLEGETLTARLQQRQLDHAECCRIGRQVANALQVAHERGVIHRDLKPDNLFLVPDMEVIGGERVKVLDFGMAKLAGELHSVGVKTGTGVLMGTLSYMSPEQCRSAVKAEPRSDIYSLGCILFEMVCGRPPFADGGLGDIIAAHLHTPPRDPRELAPDVPPALAKLILDLLAKRPDARPQTMAAVSQGFAEILRTLDATPHGSSTPSPDPDLTMPVDWARKRNPRPPVRRRRYRSRSCRRLECFRSPRQRVPRRPSQRRRLRAPPRPCARSRLRPSGCPSLCPPRSRWTSAPRHRGPYLARPGSGGISGSTATTAGCGPRSVASWSPASSSAR